MEEILTPEAKKYLENIVKEVKNEFKSSETQINEEKYENTQYDASRLFVEIPGSNHVEKIDFIPPSLDLLYDSNSNDENPPDFIVPKPYFDIFEHFNYEWIEIPEFED